MNYLKKYTQILLLWLGLGSSIFAQDPVVVLYHKGELKDWKPPVVKEKVWESRQVKDRLVIRQGGRHVCLEQCEDEPISLDGLMKHREGGKFLKQEKTDSQESGKRLENWPVVQMIGISASMHEHEGKWFTRFSAYLGKKRITGWSKVDFNHLRGVGSFAVDDREYMMLAGFGKDLILNAVDAGCPKELLNGRKDLVFDAGGDFEAEQAMVDLLLLYSVEKDYLKRQWVQRQRNRKLKQKWDEANPPQPKDIKIRFWKRQPKGNQ